MEITVKNDLPKSKKKICKVPRPKRGRPKRSHFTRIRTRAWAQYCSWLAGGEKRKVGSYKLAEMTDSYSENWRQHLSGKRGVTTKTVNKINTKIERSCHVFHIGPKAKYGKDMGFTADRFSKNGGHVPLWAAISGDTTTLMSQWQSINCYWWLLWAPWQMPSDPHQDIFLHLDHNDAEFIAQNKDSIVYDETEIIANTEIRLALQKKYWAPSEEDFRDKIALKKLLYDYAKNPACYPDTSSLTCLTACISLSRLENSEICVLPPLFPYKELASDLNILNISFHDIVKSACEFGLTLLKHEDWAWITDGNKAQADEYHEQKADEENTIHKIALKIRASYRESDRYYFPVNSTKPYGYF